MNDPPGGLARPSGAKCSFFGLSVGYFGEPRLSLDDSQLILHQRQAHETHPFLFDLKSGVGNWLTSEASVDYSAVWSPDSLQIAYSSNQNGQWNLFLRPASGQGSPTLVGESPNQQIPGSWTRNGNLLAFVERIPASAEMDIWLQPMDAMNAKPTPFLNTPEVREVQPRFSLDGNWLAYASDKEKQFEIFIHEVVREGGKVVPGRYKKVSKDGGWEPVWSHDGKELFYRSKDGKRLLSSAIDTAGSLSVGEERTVLPELPSPEPNLHFSACYDVSNDNQKFLILTEIKKPAMTRLILVQNWFEEIKRIASAGK